MKNRSILQLLCFLFCTIVILSGCSSIEKARVLYADGKYQDAFDMATEHLSADKEESIRFDAIHLIGQIGMENNGQLRTESGKVLLPLLDDSAPFLRASVVKNLGILKYELASPKLIEMSLSADEDTQEEIGVAVKNIGSKAIALLVQAYQNEQDLKNRKIYKKVILLSGSEASKQLKEISQ